MSKAKKKKPVAKQPETALARLEPLTVSQTIEKVLIQGDLAPLTVEERIDYYKKVCQSLGLNPLTRPFDYILFKEYDSNAPAKLSLYANKSCAEQLRKIHGISVVAHRQQIDGEMCSVEVELRDRTGKTDISIGVLPLFKMKDGKKYKLEGRELANALMKCSTKAKRRATLSISGLAFLDESELDTMQVLGGVTPDGRVYRYPELEERTNGSREAAQEVAREKIAKAEAGEPIQDEIVQEKPKEREWQGDVELDWSENEASPILRGDIGNLLEVLKLHCTLTWGQDSWWHCVPRDAETIRAACDQLAFRLKEVMPKSSSPRGKSEASQSATIPNRQAEGASQTGAKATPGKKTTAAPAVSPTQAPQLVAGVIAQANPQSGKSPRLDVLLKLFDEKGSISKVAVWMSAWDTAHFPHLTAGKDKPAELWIKKNAKGDKVFTNIVGLKRCAGKEFDEDGKTPIIQQKDREPGNRTLFGT